MARFPRGRKSQREQRPRGKPSGRPLEAPVIAAVGDLLRVHPNVLFAVRQNSGALPYQNAEGRMVPVWFYKILRSPEKVRIVDFWGLLKSGPWGGPCLFAIECKPPGWTKPRDDREREQAAFVKMVLDIMGMAGFATSVEAAIAIIEG